jgi:hypothetical protein
MRNINEAWHFLIEGDSQTTTTVIVQGFRNARKCKGGFGVLTQNLADWVATIQSSPFSRILFSTKGHELDAIKQYMDAGLSVLLAAEKGFGEHEARK